MMPVLSLDHVSVRYPSPDGGVAALTAVSLHVNAGEMVVLLGPSGSGKSTLIRIAAGIDDCTSGVVSIGGLAIGTRTASQRAVLRRREVGVVFQQLNLIPSLSALENVMLPLELDGVPTGLAGPVAREALEWVGLAEYSDRFPDQMSGGQQQRTAIARAIVGDRPLLLADEPTAALDSTTGEMIVELLRKRADQGTAVVLVTHDANFASYADRVIFLRDGSIVDETVRLQG